jgi:hypothetical protein
MAILLNVPRSDACIAALEAEDKIAISAGTVAEALIVAARRNVGAEMASIIDGLGFEVVTVAAAGARRIAEAYGGKVLRGGVCSISATVLLTNWPRSASVSCSMWARISQRPIS